MDNREIAWILLQIGNLVELRGDSKYAGQSYKRAARLIERSDPIVELIQRNELKKLEGIGDKISQNIIDIVNLGYSPKLNGLREQLSDDLISLINIQGLTSKRVYQLHKELGVDSLSKLEQVVENRELLKVKGFGLSTLEEIQKGIQLYKQQGKSYLLAFALPLAYGYIKEYSKLYGVDKVELCGDLRRMKETVYSIDLLLSSSHGWENLVELNQAFFSKNKLRKSRDKIRAVGKFNIPINIYLTESKDYGYEKIVNTGNEAHVKQLKLLGLDELDAKDTEEMIYNDLGLDFIPPYIREGDKEIELAKGSRLPELISIADIKGDLHNHTNYSDGLSTISELVSTAKGLGYKYVGITDHSQSLKIAKGLTKDRILKQWKEIEQIQQKYEIKILRGIEVDILADGTLDFEDDFLDQFDVVIASVHSHFKQTEREMTMRIVNAIKNPHVDIIGHLTGRLINKRSAYSLDIDEIFRFSSDNKIAFEINSSPDRLDLKAEHVQKAKDFGLKVAINTDSHSTVELANILLGVGTGQRGYLEKKDVLNCWELKELETYLRG